MPGHRKASASRQQQRGMSLVELMVAITIGLILTAGLIQLFVASKRSFRLQESATWMQEGARYALSRLTYDLRMAGHWGGIEAKAVDSDSAMLLSCEQGTTRLPRDEVIGIMGFEGGASCNGNLLDNTQDSDVLAIQYAAIDQRIHLRDLSGSEPYVASMAGFGGVLSQGNALKDTTKFIHAGKDMELVYGYPYTSAIYYIRRCSNMNNGACSDDIPTLVKMVWDGSAVLEEPIAEYVETMQIEYGVADNRGIIDAYRDAGEMSSDDWDDISAVRITLVVRSDERDVSYEDEHDSANKYDLPGNEITPDDYAVPESDKNFRRKIMTQVIKVRNSGRG